MVCGSRRLAIRVNGKYEEDIILEGNATTLHGVKVSESNLKVTLSGIENLPSGDEYTYELWIGRRGILERLYRRRAESMG